MERKRYGKHWMKYALAALLVGMLISLLIASIRKDTDQLIHHLGTSSAAIALLVVVPALGKRWIRVFQAILVVFGFSLAALTTLSASCMFSFLCAGGRATLWVENPNTLGAAIVVSAFGALPLISVRLRVVALIFVLAGVIATASSTALIALVVGAVAVAVNDVNATTRSKKVRRVALGSTLLLILLVGAYLFRTPQSDRNLLYFSGNLLHAVWNVDNSRIAVRDLGQASSPIDGWSVYRFTGKSDSVKRSLLSQGSIKSVSSKNYVSSVFLRADAPITLELSSNLATTRCLVTSDWSRCETPSRAGNDRTFAQFHIRALEGGEASDFDLVAPQLEVGVSPGIPVLTLGPPLLNLLPTAVWRDAPLLSQAGLDSIALRMAIFKKAFHLFLDAPILGHGWRSFETVEPEKHSRDTPQGIRHAHNFIFHILAEEGLLGLIAAIMPILVATWLAVLFRLRQLLPLFLSLAVLNTFDFTLYSDVVYYPAYLSVALVISKAMEKHSIVEAEPVSAGKAVSSGRRRLE